MSHTCNCNLVFIAWEDENGEPTLSPFTSPVLPRVDDMLNVVNIDSGASSRYRVTDIEWNITMSTIEEEVDLDNIIICVVLADDIRPYSLEELNN